ncbi:MAG: flagellar filament capping protein FliD [Acidobacteria bacterium]|nr:flagellar filament capping protein FliD [Acidobacteriota bacterium]MBI3425671.1 flagellar filament capping protein FliD [Acidobacteriota bacterium]
MATVNFNGVGSGLDFKALTDSILAEKSRPLSQLQNKNAESSKRSDALKQLNARLLALTAAADALNDRTLGNGRTASSSAANVATATSSAEAATASINLTVTRLATSLTQTSRVYTSDTAAVLAGGATTATFELRKGGASTGTAITIDSSNNTLTGLRDAINKAGAGVNATIVDVDGTGTKFKLALNSNATGTAGRVELVETSATGTAADLNLTAVNPPGATTDFSDLDASFSLNGLALTRSSNTVSDAVTGLTFNLKSSGSTTISVTSKTSDLNEKLNSLVAAYNDVQSFIAGQYTKDGQGRPSGPLAGDATLRTVQRQIREALGGNAGNNGGAFKNLAELGLSRDDSGKLTLDATVLNEKLSNNLGDVQALLAGKSEGFTGLAAALHDEFDKLSDAVTGTVTTAINGYQDSIKRTEKNIAAQLARLSDLRQSLNRQFAIADAAIGQLNGQSTQLTTILDSLKPKSA